LSNALEGAKLCGRTQVDAALFLAEQGEAGAVRAGAPPFPAKNGSPPVIPQELPLNHQWLYW
jgi:hypothetical protein